MPSPSSATGRRLGALFLGYLTAAVALITLAPFQFARPDEFRVAWVVLDGGWATDVVLNVVLFVPLGVLWQRMTGHYPRVVFAVALLAGLAIESAQLFLAPRYTTVSDLLANGLGGYVGALLGHALDGRLDAPALMSRLWLDQPLMGLVSLLIPLAWLVGLSSTSDPTRLWLLLPIGAAAALGIAAVAMVTQPIAAQGIRAAPLIASAVWAAMAMVPSLRVSPSLALGSVGATLVMAVVGGMLWRVALRRERRLEPQVVRVLLPVLLLIVAGLARDGGSIDVAGGGEAARESLLRTLAIVAGFTLVGYVIAESRGRRQETLGRLTFWPVTLAALFAGVLLLAAGPELMLVPLLAVALAAAVGAALYDAQRAHILALLAER